MTRGDRIIAARHPARPAHWPSRRSELIIAARQLFGSEQADENVSMAEIADRADMGVSAAYYHFSSTEELIETMIEELFDGVAERFGPEAGEESVSAWARASLRRHVAWIDAARNEARFLVAVSDGSPGGPQALAFCHIRMDAVTGEIAEDILGLRPDTSAVGAYLVARGFLGLITELARLMVDDRDDDGVDRGALLAAAEILVERLVGADGDSEHMSETNKGTST